jgi:alkanesulfonate monooxygenase SsuD/methylene tetrahydromethanopterin reductase-like flavin-dependent oxidoreductase (luciferase family)
MLKPTFGWIVQTTARNDTQIDHLLEANHRTIERLAGPFESLWFDDHFHKDGAPILESWTALCYLAAQYPQMKFGTLVLCQSYRNPALVAKMMATLQVFTGGRFMAGIGAGWKEDEYQAYGYPFPAGHIRIDQLREAVQILKRMWRHSPATFEGRYYSVREATCEPLPHPPPPLLIAGGGERMTLRLVAEEADLMNLAFVTPQQYAHKLDVLQRHCAAVGRDAGTIRKTLWAYVALGGSSLGPLDPRGRFILSGSATHVAGLLKAYLDLGVDYFMLRFVDYPAMEGAGQFVDKVLPLL